MQGFVCYKFFEEINQADDTYESSCEDKSSSPDGCLLRTTVAFSSTIHVIDQSELENFCILQNLKFDRNTLC